MQGNTENILTNNFVQLTLVVNVQYYNVKKEQMETYMKAYIDEKLPKLLAVKLLLVAKKYEHFIGAWYKCQEEQEP